MTYDVKVKLPQENFVAEMRDTGSAEFIMHKKYCDAVSVYLLFSLYNVLAFIPKKTSIELSVIMHFKNKPIQNSHKT